MIQLPPPEIVQLFKETPGAISLHEMLAIAWLAAQAPDGISFDLGTNAAKAAIAQAAGFTRQDRHRDLYCIDTVFDLQNDAAWADNKMQPDRMTTGWTWIHEPDFHDKVKDRIWKAGEGRIAATLIGESVLKAIPEIGKPGVAWAFCDADNANRALVDGIVDQLAPKMVDGGIIAHHDFWSQYIPPHEAQDRLIATGHFERIEIPWEEIKAAIDSIGGDHPPDQVSWHHHETPRPMFVGAIRRV